MTTWRKSAHCGASNTCVEVTPTPAGIEVRDGAAGDTVTLRFSRAEFAEFVSDVKAGRHSHAADRQAGVIPVAGWDRWLEVMERAGYRCQCEGLHPGHRGARCENEHHKGCKLLAGPKDPGPDPARTIQTCDPSELIAWCQSCWDRDVTSIRKTLRDADRVLGTPGQDALFDPDSLS